MVALSILTILIATAFSYVKIPLNWVENEKVVSISHSGVSITELISESYIKNYLNKQYSIQIYAGSPPQLLNVQISTGSPWLWIPSIKCKLSCHQATNYFDSNKSSTYKYIGRIKIKNEGYSFVKGDLSTETFTIGELNDITIKNQNFILANQDNGYDGAFFDGVLGLEYNFTMGYLTFLDRLYSSKQISNKIFSVYLSDSRFQGFYDTSAIIFGGYDLFYAQNKEIKYVNLTDKAGRWNLPIYEVKIDEYLISNSSLTAFFDVGASVIYAPKVDFDNIVNKISEFGSCEYERGNIICDCGNYPINSYPSISFALGNMSGYSFDLDPQNYFLKHDSYCYLLFGISNSDLWTFGSPFLRKYYTIFDAESFRIGFVLASQELDYSTIETLSIKLKSIDSNKSTEVNSKISANLQVEFWQFENLLYWAIAGVLLICLSRFIINLFKVKPDDNLEAYYHKINA